MEEIKQILNEYCSIKFDRIEIVRDMGSMSYTAFSGNNKYIKPPFFNTAIIGADIQVLLQNKGFPVPYIQLTYEQLPYVKNENILLILYEFIEGSDSNPKQDAEAIGALVGRLHQVMKTYPNIRKDPDGKLYIHDFDTSCEGFPMYDLTLICDMTYKP